MGEWDEPRGRLLRWIGLLAASLVALYLCWRMLQPFVEVVLWAIVLVIVFFPVHRRIRARVGSPGWSAVLSCLLVIVVILGPVVRWLGQYVDLSRIGSQEFLAERLKGVSGAIASRTLGFVGGFVGFVVEVFFVI